jgi:hypothetical protein
MERCHALITRLPYAKEYDAKPISDMVQNVDVRGLICLSIPIHVEAPNNGGKLISILEQIGLTLVAKVSWYRDRHIVTTKSRRLTNTWEPVAIFSRAKNYVIQRDQATKIKRGFEGRENIYNEEDFVTCIGDHWAIRNDRRDRRFLPATLVLNCGQLAGLNFGDRVLDPYGNPGIKDTCRVLGWTYVDGGLANSARTSKKAEELFQHEIEDLPELTGDAQENPVLSEGDGSVSR